MKPMPTVDVAAIAESARVAAMNALARAKGEAPKDVFADLEPKDSAEDDSAQEMNAVRREFQDRISTQRKRVADAIDTEFWCAVYFRNRAQKEAFLSAVSMLAEGDKYIDGERLAKRLGIDLPHEDAVFTVRAPDRRLAELAEE